MVGNQPISPASVNAAPVAIPATANALYNGAGTITDVVTAGPDGARVDGIIFKAIAATTAGMLRIFHKIAGGTYRLIDEVDVTAVVAPGATTKTEKKYWTPDGGSLQLNPNDVLGVSTHNAEAFTAQPIAGNY